MNTSNASNVQPADLLGLLSRYRRLILLGTATVTACFLAAAIVLPKRYKTAFELSIFSTYFQNPLIHDFTPEIYDTAEMKAQREGLIRQALSPEFLDTLGTRYGIYSTPRMPNFIQRFQAFLSKKYGIILTNRQLRIRSEERKDFLSRIQIVGMNNNTYQVAFLYSNPDVAYRVIQDIQNQVTRQLIDSRRNSLTSVHRAIERRLEDLAIRLPSLEKAPGTPAVLAPTATAESTLSLPMVEEELSEVRSQLRVLTTRYTEEHPLVRELRDRERSLVALSNSAPGRSGSHDKPLAVRVPQDAAEEIYKELTKKLNYLNVVLDSDEAHASDFFAILQAPLYPNAPLWPRKDLFLLWGLGAGLLGSLMLASLREYFDRGAMSPSWLSHELDIPVIGELPLVHWGASFPHNRWNPTALERPAAHN
jgi:uncharacterized protein involved in exopolysaccharide biosynthesis